MKGLLTSLILFAVIAIFGVGCYLQPDDLKNCDTAPTNTGTCQTVDAIVAVSGGDTKARVDEAVTLYKNGWSDTLIFSGAAQDKTGPSNAEAMKTIAVEAGVPAEDIYIDEYAATTEQNAENVQKIFTQNNIQKVILVTSGYHQRRASLEFNKSAPEVTILNHSAESDDDWSAVWWWTTPRGWWLIGGELVKIAIFYASGLWL